MQKKILLIVALLLSIFFVLTSWIWVYWINLFVSLPAALLAFVLFLIYRSKYGMDRGALVIVRLLTFGLIVALVCLGILLLYN